MLIAIFNKIRKRAMPNITFILNALLENGIIFVWMGLFFKIKITNANFTKFFF